MKMQISYVNSAIKIKYVFNAQLRETMHVRNAIQISSGTKSQMQMEYAPVNSITLNSTTYVSNVGWLAA